MSIFVGSDGPIDAKIVIVGEAPGEDEVSSGKPFTGSSGQLLTRMLSAAGIDRSQCYLTNIMKTRPPKNDFGFFYVDPKRRQPSPELITAIESLRQEIALVKPNVIILLGAEPLRAITGRSGISDWRGSIISNALGKCVVTYHPAYVLRQYTERITVENDLRRAAVESKSPICVLPTHSFKINPSKSEVLDFLRRRPKRVAFDIETSGPYIRCLGIADSADRAICIPFMSTPKSIPSLEGSILNLEPSTPTYTTNSYWSVDDEYEILCELNRFFSDPNIEKVAQNYPFDSLVLEREFGIDTSIGLHMDTMLAHYACYSELPKGLDYLCSIYTRVPCYWQFNVADDHATWLYNCYDCAVTFEVSQRLDEELAKTNNIDFYHKHVHRSMLAYTRAETRGVLVDIEARKVISDRTKLEVSKLLSEITTYTGGVLINPNSDKQVKEYIYGVLKLKEVLDRKTKNPTSGKEALEKLSKDYPQHAGFLSALLLYGQKSSLISRLLDRELGADGRIRTHYHVAGAVTGRLKSSEPIFEFGTNLQNIDRGEIRRLFISDYGWSIIKADLSQAEWRIVAWKAKIRWVIERYQQDPTYDIHREIASIIFRIAKELITKEQRSIAKNGVYGGQYGMYYTTAAATYKLDLKMAKYVLDRFHQEFPQIKEVFWKSIQEMLTTTRRVTNPFGRTRVFFDRMEIPDKNKSGYDTQKFFREAYSHYAQSIVADVISAAFIEADDLFDPSECYSVLQVHDEMVCLCRDDKLDEYIPRVRKALERPVIIEPDLPPLIIPAEIAVGKNWYDVKEVKK